MPVTVAVIPARGGSKGLPGKNLMKVGSVPLVARAIQAALGTSRIDAVFVSSEDRDILECAKAYGARPIERASEIACDTTSSEAVLLAALDHPDVAALKPDTIVMIQCTSPFTSSGDIGKLVALLDDERFAAAVTVVEDHGFLWAADGDGIASGINHDIAQQRARRQDIPPQYRETGAAYAMRVAPFRASSSRFCGPVGLVVTDHPPIEIDSREDLELVRIIASQTTDETLPAGIFSNIRALVTDFDGVHTDDCVWVDQNGVESVRCSRSDGMGIERLRKAGFPVLILSKETNAVVAKRADKLEIPVIQGEADKLSALEGWAAQNGIAITGICFVGNDVNDVEALEAAGLAVVPDDARKDAKSVADIILKSAGGHGAVREICDLLLTDISRRSSDGGYF